MSEYIPKYPSKEGDDSNKTSSELLAETLKPIYVPQDLMLAWESHLASYSRDTNVLLDQVKDSELALNTQYQALLARVQKYEQMLQDITMDSNEFTMDTDEVNFTGWNILAQASYWDYLLRKEITKLSDQIKSTEYKGGLVTEVTDAVLEGLIADNTYISNVIGALSDTPLIRELDAALTSTVTSITDLQAESVRLAEKQAADAEALANQQVLNVEQLVADINTSKAEQLNRLAEEAAIRTQLLQELEAKTDAITADYNAVVDTLHTTVIQELTAMQAGISASVSELKTADEAIITSLDAYKVSNGQNIAALQNSVNVVTNTQESIATQVTGLIASVDQIDLGLSKAQADIITSNQARVDGDAALSQQITTINTGLGDANSRIDTVNTAVSTLDTATATKFSALNAELIDVNTSVASARQIADSAVTANTAQASEINTLNARMSTTEGNVTNKADATALSNLETKVDNADAALSIRIDSLVANITTSDGTEVDANAFNTLRAEVLTNSGNITTHTSQINALSSSLSNVNTGLTANADAVSDLTATVTQQGESITLHSQAIQQLQSDLDVAEAGLATKASTSALNTTNTNVSNIDGRVTTEANRITSLTGRVSTVEGAVSTKADASALNSLTTRVATEEGKSTSQGSAITSLQNTINHATTGLATKASSSALTATNSEVTRINGVVTGHTNQLTQLASDITTINGTLATKADASALVDIYTKTQADDKATEIAAGQVADYSANLKIGGDNLIRNGNFAGGVLSKWGAWGSVGSADRTVEQVGNKYFAHLVGKDTSVFKGISQSNAKFERNTEYVISFVAYSNAENQKASFLIHQVGANNDPQVYLQSPALTSTATKYELRFKSADVDKSRFTFMLSGTNGTAYDIYITDIMLQIGTKATEWVESYLDAQEATDANASAIATTNAEVSRINGVVTSQGTSITNLQAGLTTANNNIATKADGSALTALTTRVSNAEGSISTQSSKTTALEAKISSFKAAGRNYLRDSKAAGEKNINPEINTVLAPSTGIRMSFDIEIRTPVQAGWRNRIGFECSFEVNGTAHYCGVWLNNASSTGAGKRRVYGTFVLPSSWTAGVSAFPSTFPYHNQTSGGDFTVSNIQLEVGDAYTDWTPAPEDNASASALSTLDTKVTAIDGKVTTHASSITQLQADVGSNSAKLIVHGEAVDGLKASYVVKTDVNGLVAGYGLYNTGSSSAFGVNADYFYVGKGTAATGGKKPFMVLTSSQTIDGITYPAGTWINTAIIANATIGTAHIADASITNAKIKDASITDAKIESLSASKISVPTSDPFPVKVTANDVTVTSNKSISGAVAALFDGAFAAGSAYVTFGTATVDRSEDAYLQVDLKSVRKIAQVVLWFYSGDGRTYEYKIKYSNDGSNWKYLEGNPTVWIKSSQPKPNNEGTYANTATPTQVHMGSLFECRYLRIYGNGNTVSTGNHLYELEIASQAFNTVIDGSGILTNSITSDKLQVNSLSAISGNLGTIKVGSANIDSLAVDTLHLKDRAVTVPLGIQQQISTANFTGNVGAGWVKDVLVNFPGIEVITSGSFCTLFFRSDFTFRSPIPDNLLLEVYIGSVLIGSIKSVNYPGGIEWGWVSWSGEGESGKSWEPVGVEYSALIMEQGSIQVAFTMPPDVTAGSALRFRFKNIGGNRSVTTAGSYVNLYLVEFKK